MASWAWLLAAAALLAVSLLAPARADDGADLLARGELVFNAGGCTNCHTAKGGPPLAGGDAIQSPYGAFYAPNITPDRETGIGGWSEADFARAMREGRAPDGSPKNRASSTSSYTKSSP